MACEVTIRIKNPEKSTTQKKTIHGEVKADFTDPQIDDFISQVQKNFGGDPVINKIKVTISLLG